MRVAQRRAARSSCAMISSLIQRAAVLALAIGLGARADDVVEVAVDLRPEAPDRTQRALSRDGTWKVSSGMMPRGSGENHGSHPLVTAIGNQPLA